MYIENVQVGSEMAESNHTSNADVLMHIIEMQSAQIKALTESNNKD